MARLTTLAKNRSMVIVTVAVLLVCAVFSKYVQLALPWLKSSGHEAFAPQLPTNWKGPKTPLVAVNGLHWFFSDGSLKNDTIELSKHVYFMPSEKDTLCYYTQQGTPMPDKIKFKSMEINCRLLLPSEFAVEDQRPLPRDMNCSNKSIDQPPLASEDAEMRVLNSTYYFHKRCMTLRDVRFTQTGSTFTMELDSTSYSTKALMLLRPIFISSMNSMLYSVSYAGDGSDYAIGDNTPIDYDSTREQTVRVILTPTKPYSFENKQHHLSSTTTTIPDDIMGTDSVMSERSNRSINSRTMQGAMKGVVEGEYAMMNVYYAAPKESLIETQRKPAQTLTVVFRNPTQGKQPVAGIQLFNQEINVSIAATRGTGSTNTLTVNRGTTVKQVKDLPLDATIVVTYSHNLVVVAAISPITGSVRIQRLPAFSPLLVPDAYNSILHSHLKKVRDSSLLTYDVFSIPNLLHIAMDLSTKF